MRPDVVRLILSELPCGDKGHSDEVIPRVDEPEDAMKALDLSATAVIMIVGTAALLWSDSLLLAVCVTLALAVPWVFGVLPAIERRRESEQSTTSEEPRDLRWLRR